MSDEPEEKKPRYPPLPHVIIDSNITKSPLSLGRWRVWVGVYGPLCAAWLVRDRRRSIKSGGGFDIFVPRGVDISIQSKDHRWFKLALSFIRKRPSWQVRERTRPNGTTFEFRWLRSRHSRTTLLQASGGLVIPIHGRSPRG